MTWSTEPSRPHLGTGRPDLAGRVFGEASHGVGDTIRRVAAGQGRRPSPEGDSRSIAFRMEVVIRQHREEGQECQRYGAQSLMPAQAWSHGFAGAN